MSRGYFKTRARVCFVDRYLAEETSGSGGDCLIDVPRLEIRLDLERTARQRASVI